MWADGVEQPSKEVYYLNEIGMYDVTMGCFNGGRIDSQRGRRDQRPLFRCKDRRAESQEGWHYCEDSPRKEQLTFS